MKRSELKQLFKEAVKEVFQEELKEILLEAVKSPRSASPNIMESTTTSPINQTTTTSVPLQEKKENIRKVMAEMYSGMGKIGSDGNIEMNTSHMEQPLQIGSLDTMSEGSSLPAGDVPLDLIKKFTGGK